MSVSYGPVARFRRWCSSQYLRISPLHWEFPLPLPYSSHLSFHCLYEVKPRALTADLNNHLRTLYAQ